jgi:hypothetical protein
MATAAAPGVWIPRLSGFCGRNDGPVNAGSLNLEGVFILWYRLQRHDESLRQITEAMTAGCLVLTGVHLLW